MPGLSNRNASIYNCNVLINLSLFASYRLCSLYRRNFLHDSTRRATLTVVRAPGDRGINTLPSIKIPRHRRRAFAPYSPRLITANALFKGRARGT